MRKRLLAAVTVLAGLMNILSAWLVQEPTRLSRLHEWIPLEVSSTSRLASVVAGAGLLLLGRALSRGKRTAWYLAVVLLSGSLVSHLLKGLDAEEALASGAVLGLLIRARGDFRAGSDTPTLRRGFVLLLVTLAGALAYGMLGFFVLDRHFGARFDLVEALRLTISRFFLSDGPRPVSGRGHWFVDSLDLIGLLTLTVGAWAILRPVVWRRTTGREERARAGALLEQYGANPLGRFTLLPDKVYHFSAEPEGYVAFRPTGVVALALGDPVASPEGVSAVARSFLDLCARCDWKPALYQVRPDHLGLYGEMGLRSLKIGEEAVIPLAGFTLEGSTFRKERNVLSRGERDGLVMRLYRPPHTPELLRELEEVSTEWLLQHGGREKSFSLGAFGPEYVGGSPVATVEETTGRIQAFVNLVPGYRWPGVAIDLMRHRGDARSVMEFLILSLARRLREDGVERLSLGLAPLSGVGGADAGGAERAVHFLYEHLNRFYSFQGLRQFKEKFHPEWESRYLVYAKLTDLPRIAVALVRADSGDDWPQLFRGRRDTQ